MKAYRINQYIIAADMIEEAADFFCQETGEPLPECIEEVDWQIEVPCQGGKIMTVRDLIHNEMDERNAWLRMGIPCDLHCPFIIAKLT